MYKKLVCILIFVLTLLDFKVAYAQNLKAKNILIIHSYSYTYKWTYDIQSGITSVINKENVNARPNIYTTYMDIERLSSSSYKDDLVKYYKLLSSQVKFDGIICLDNNAFDFMTQYRDELFSDTPVVFCGMNYYNDDLKNKMDNFTGIVAPLDYKKTFDSILKLQPNVKNVVFIASNSKAGQQECNSVNKIESKYSNRFKIHYCINNSMEQIIDIVNGYGKNTAVVLAQGVGEMVGEQLNIEDTAENLYDKINVPIYSFYDFEISKGVMGGYIMSGYDEGQSAARMMLDILNGKSASSIPIVKSLKNKYLFDYNLLKRFNININNVPKGSVIVNKPRSFMSQYWKLTLLIGIILTILILLIILLLLNVRKRVENEKKLNCSYDELSATHEELLATEEELRQQYVELQTKEEQIRTSEERYKLAVQGSKDAIWEFDFSNNKLFVSDKFFEMTGFDVNGEYNRKYMINKMVYFEDRKKAERDISNYLTGVTANYESEFRVVTKWGDVKWILNRGKLLKDKHEKLVKIAGSLTDTSDRKNAEEQIKYMAYYDYLTKLPNRIYFMEKLRKKVFKSIMGNEKGAVLFVDLDNFKNINDTLGHDYGDKLLVSVGEKMTSRISSDNIVSRFGGDEFLILLHNMKNKAEVIEVTNNIINVFQKPFDIADKKIYLTASIGIAIYPEDGVDANIVIKNADTAMYKSKNTGKNKFVFYDKEMHNAIYRKLSIEKGLRGAFVKNEFLVYFQPFVDVKTQKIVGSEALSRWNNDELGFVSPGEFIPVAEENGFISSLGAWVFKTACVQNKKWLDMGYKCNVSINVSAAQLQQHDFVDVITKILKEVNHPPEYIDIEITESTFMQNMDYNIGIMKKFANMGMKIALDDFGTGYSSLNYLKKLPINILKIDKSFIDDISLNSDNKSIVDGIIQLAHKMNLEVIAEGVECKEQVEILKSINCDRIQGYYYSRPVLPELLEKMF